MGSFLPNGYKFDNFKVFLSIVAVLILANLLYLDTKLLENKTTVVSESKTSANNNSCPTSCETKINDSIAALKTNPVPSATSETTAQTQAIIQSSSIKDYFIPLGTGVNSTQDFANVTGAQAYIDSSQYSGIKTVTFEAAFAVYNANEDVYVRLYNVTDKHPVWNSELKSNVGSSGVYLVSSPVSLDSGNKLYQVQMKTQLGAAANLTQARIHIVLK